MKILLIDNNSNGDSYNDSDNSINNNNNDENNNSYNNNSDDSSFNVRFNNLSYGFEKSSFFIFYLIFLILLFNINFLK